MARYRMLLDASVTVEGNSPEDAVLRADEWVRSFKASSFDEDGKLRSLAVAIRPETVDLFDDPVTEQSVGPEAVGNDVVP